MIVQRNYVETGAHKQQIDQQITGQNDGHQAHVHQKAQLAGRRPALIEEVVHIKERRSKCVLVHRAGGISPRPADYRLQEIQRYAHQNARGKAFRVERQRVFGS